MKEFTIERMTPASGWTAGWPRGPSEMCGWLWATSFNYISTTSFLNAPHQRTPFLSLYQPKLNILYEDEHILLLDKRPGLVVHPG